MLRTHQLEEIERHLLAVPALADRFAQRDAGFASELVAWLEDLERILSQNKLAIVSTVAATRATVVSAGRGAIPNGITIHGRATRRKVLDATAIDALQSITRLIEQTIQPDRDRQQQAQDLMRRIVSIAVAKQLPGFGPRARSVPVDQLWGALRSDEDTHGGVVQLDGIVGHTDALILLDRGASGT